MGEAEKVINVVVQQPQFLPWAGLWHKVISADVYVLYTGVKFDQSDHQHRVTLNSSWLTLPVEKGQRNVLIKDVKLASGYRAGLHKLATTIRQTCMGRKNPHRDRLGPIVQLLEAWDRDWMLDLNNTLFLAMMRVLGVSPAPVVLCDVEERDHLDKIPKLDACLRAHIQQPFRYLAGAGGLDYMGYDSLTSPLETLFQRMHEGTDPNSVLQLIATHDNPLEVIKTCAHWLTKEGQRREWDAR